MIDKLWELRAKETRRGGGEPCEGCGRRSNAEIIDESGCDLCDECAAGCEVEERRHEH